MGYALSKAVDTNMPRLLSQNKTQSNCKTTSSATAIFVSGRYNRSRYKLPQPQPVPSTRRPNVLVVSLDDEDDDDFNFPPNYKARRWDSHDYLEELNDLAEDFGEIEAILSVFDEDDESARIKLRKFILSWKACLLFPHTKKGRTETYIPVAATSYCKHGITRWQRCGRSCLQCLSRSTSDHMEDDLVRKDSLTKFMAETQKDPDNGSEGTSAESIEQRQLQRRKDLHDHIYLRKWVRPKRDNADHRAEPCDITKTECHLHPNVSIEYVPEKDLTFHLNTPGSTKRAAATQDRELVTKRRFSDSVLAVNEGKNVK